MARDEEVFLHIIARLSAIIVKFAFGMFIDTR